MKMRYLFIAAATILPFAASAVKPIKSGDYHHMNFVPSDFGYDGQPSFFLESDDDGFIRVNEDLETVETFKLPKQTLAIKKSILLPSGFKTGYYYQQTGGYDPESLPEALEIIQRIYPKGYVTVDMRVDGREEDRKILFIPGNKIPEKVFNGINNEYLYILGSEDSLDGIEGYAVYQSWKDSWVGAHTLYVSARNEYNTGELDWSTELKVHNEYTRDFDITYFDEVFYNDGKHSKDLYITQTLFNADKDYEILVPILKENGVPTVKDGSGGWIDYTYEGRNGEETASTDKWKEEVYPIEYSGVGVVNLRTGEVSTIFEFTEPYNISRDYYYFSSPDILVLGNKRYLQISVPQDDDYERLYYIYEINGAQSGVQTPVISKRVSVKPSIVNRGEDVMVNVDGNDAISAITLTGMNGQTLQNIKGNGAKSAAVKTGRLGSGVHIVGVQTSDGANTYNKIIVK